MSDAVRPDWSDRPSVLAVCETSSVSAAGEHVYHNGLHLRDGINSIQRYLGGQDLRLAGALTALDFPLSARKA
ncbi:MAG: hypothetical protein ABJN26_14875 [Stappiaceae bacterium]